jgi:4-hydroxy-tetrahydrodipicolinate reductase
MPLRGWPGFAGAVVSIRLMDDAARESAGRDRMKVALNGRGGKVGTVLAPALEHEGHELVELSDGAEAMVDFTAPEAVVGNVRAALAAGVPCVVGTTGWDPSDVEDAAVEAGLPVFYAPNFAVGAVLMMRFAAEAAEHLPRAEIVELHHETKKDAPSGTARATAERLGGGTPIHSVRLPGLVAHQEVLFGGEGQVLTIRHDTLSREAFVPGVLLALEKLPTLPPGVTVGLEALL